MGIVLLCKEGVSMGVYYCVYFIFILKIIPFIISGCAGSLLLHRLFSSCCGQGLLSSCGLLIVVASLDEEHGL